MLLSRHTRRREFISLVGGTAAAWPLAATAQTPERIRLIGMLAGINDPDIKAFQQELEKRGWSEGRNIHIESRYAPAGTQAQALAKELVAMQPEVIFAVSRPITTALQKETHTIPIVFTYVIDPVGAGFIASFTHPGGNLTGLIAYEPSTVGKWLGMLKEVAPQTVRVAILGNPKTAVYFDYLLGAARAVAPTLGIEATPSHIENDAADIERAIAAIAGYQAWSCCRIARPPSITISSSRSRLATAYRQFTALSLSSRRAVLCPTGLSVLIIIGRQRSTSIEFSAVLSRPSCRYRLRRSMRPPSISKRLKSLV